MAVRVALKEVFGFLLNKTPLSSCRYWHENSIYTAPALQLRPGMSTSPLTGSLPDDGVALKQVVGFSRTSIKYYLAHSLSHVWHLSSNLVTGCRLSFCDAPWRPCEVWSRYYRASSRLHSSSRPSLPHQQLCRNTETMSAGFYRAQLWKRTRPMPSDSTLAVQRGLRPASTAAVSSPSHRKRLTGVSAFGERARGSCERGRGDRGGRWERRESESCLACLLSSHARHRLTLTA